MSRQRLTVQEAAEVLELTVDAVRKRVERGTIEHEKDQSGRVWILLDADRTLTGPRHELVETLRDQVAHLREQLAEEREARRRADTIIAQLSQTAAEQARTIRALEAPESPPEPVQEEEPPDDAGGPERPISRPWWKFWG